MGTTIGPVGKLTEVESEKGMEDPLAETGSEEVAGTEKDEVVPVGEPEPETWELGPEMWIWEELGTSVSESRPVEVPVCLKDTPVVEMRLLVGAAGVLELSSTDLFFLPKVPAFLIDKP